MSATDPSPDSPVDPPAVHARETAAPEAPVSVRGSLASLLAGHVLQDGEVVLLILKPSRWFMILSALKFLAGSAIACIAGWKLWPYMFQSELFWAQLFVLIAVGRLGWATLVWMGRYYLLTNLRIIRLSGVFEVDIFACPLRRVARTRLIYTTRERLTLRGSVEIIPDSDDRPVGVWQTLRQPAAVKQQIDAAISRAKQGMGHE
jgi:hypothetical protein